MTYVDGFVMPIPKKNLAAYKKMAAQGAEAWKRHGALEYFECVGDDLSPKGMPGMKITHFPALAKAKAGETVVFSFIVYKSKAHRDAVNKKVMKEMSAQTPERKRNERCLPVRSRSRGAAVGPGRRTPGAGGRA